MQALVTDYEEMGKDFVRDVAYIPAYEPAAVEGAPCSLKVVGTNLKDEELVRETATIAAVLLAGCFFPFHLDSLVICLFAAIWG